MLRHASTAAFLFVLAFMLSETVTRASPVNFRVCPKKKDQLGITSIDVSPAKVNSPVTIVAKGKTQVAMATGAKIQMLFKQGNSQTPVRVFDFCGVIKTGGSSCPLKRGAALSATINHEISKFAKPGVATATVRVLSGRGAEISCVTADIEIVA
jgi:hypothetical protein